MSAGSCVRCQSPSSGPAPDFTQTLMFNSVREDGYAVRGITIQGVRSYDSNTTQWTTPDAYKGDVHDPMSQRSYMWNNNNPISYSDPSGYVPEEEEQEEGEAPVVKSRSIDKMMQNTRLGSFDQRQTVAVGQQIGKQAGIPSNWSVSTNVKNGIVKFTQPGTQGATQIRIMPGKASATFANSRTPYVRVTINGKPVDANGNIVSKTSGAAHISTKDFSFKQVFKIKP